MIKDKTKNQINVIYPYRTKGGWSFDDEEVELQGEPFVEGVPELIDSVVGKVNNFTAFISKDLIPDFTLVLHKVLNVKEEGWYKVDTQENPVWLCPATLKYFENYPEKIYVKIKI